MAQRAAEVNTMAHRRGAYGRISANDIRALVARYEGRCVFCGVETMGIDHDLPIVLGGRNVPENLQLCCKRCNERKNRRTSEQFIAGQCTKGHSKAERSQTQRVIVCLTCARERQQRHRAGQPHRERLRRTHCKQGHPFAGENLRLNGRGVQVCLACARDADRRYKEAHRKVASA